MSKSQPKTENPCSKFIEFKSDEGKFYYFDKTKGEKGQNVEVPLPIYFATLDELATITGYNKRNDCGIFSNEVSSVKNEILNVRTFKGGESVIGLYADIRESIVAMGGKFTKSVYALLIDADYNTQFVNFKFRGAAFSAWLDKKFNAEKFIVVIQELVEEKNGNNTYNVPVFKAFKMSPEIDAAAIEQDKILQAYLKIYKEQQPEKEIAQAEAEIPEPVKKEEPKSEWVKESRENRMERAKEAMIPAGEPKGKQPVKAMSDVNDLPGANDMPEVDNINNLPL
jgi:hypothetical protein